MYSFPVTSGISSAWLELGNDFMPENCLVLSGNYYDSIHNSKPKIQEKLAKVIRKVEVFIVLPTIMI